MVLPPHAVQNPLWQSLLQSIFRVLLGAEKLHRYQTLDWQQEGDRFRQSTLAYPPYYSSQNFHGIDGGYLNPIAAITYDTVTALASPPHETQIRQRVLAAVAGQPKRILDLGCGTGSTTLMLQQAFPQARVTGLDLSPYMLVVANYKAQQAGLNIQWLHGLAEETQFEDAAFDLIVISMLFHEMPPIISRLVLQECMRLLQPGGQVIMLDGNQRRLRHAKWLIQLFREPYSAVYAAENLEEHMSTIGFETVQTEPVGWIHQVTYGRKPRGLSLAASL